MVHFGVDSLGNFRVHGHSINDHMEKGRSETGSYFEQKSNQIYNDATNGIERLAGDKWSLLHPRDNNASVKTIVDIKSEIPPVESVDQLRGDKTLVVCTSKIPNAFIASIYPIRGQVKSKMGAAVYRIEVLGSRVRSLPNGAKVVRNDLFTYQATFYGVNNQVLGVADVFPNLFYIGNEKNVDFVSYRARPAVGGVWIGEGGKGRMMVEEEDAQNCLNGVFCPWNTDVCSLLELCLSVS